MQAYLIIFSKDSADAPIRVLRAQKRVQGYFFSGGYISGDAIDTLSVGTLKTVDSHGIRRTENELKIDDHIYYSPLPASYTVKIYPSLKIGIYNGVNLVRSIYLNGFNIRSNPGQKVFPGGKVNAGETAQQAVLREFKEECGEQQNKMNIYNTAIQHIEYFNSDAERVTTPQNNGFGIVYAKITNVNLNSLQAFIHASLSKPQIYERIPEVKDDELSDVECIGLDTAIAGFTYDDDYKKDLTWYQKAGEYLKDNYNTLFPG